MVLRIVAGLDVDRAGFLVDDVLGDVAADDRVERHEQLLDLALVDDFLHRARGNLLASLEDDLAGLGIDQVHGRTGAAHALGEEPGDPALVLLQLEVDGLVIGIHDAFLVHAEGVEQGRHRQFAAAVDAGEDNVFRVELEIEPGAAVGDDAAGEEQLARSMRLALVMVEEHTGRAVHLGDDHPLGAVHDEGAVVGHERHVTHEHVLFLDILDRLRTGVFVDIEHDQAEGHLQRRRVGHVALLAFLDVVFRRLELVFHELQHRGLVEILDRENRLEHALDAVAIGGLGAVAGVQEQVIARFLHLDEVRHLQHFADFAVVFTKTFLAKVGLRH